MRLMLSLIFLASATQAVAPAFGSTQRNCQDLLFKPDLVRIEISEGGQILSAQTTAGTLNFEHLTTEVQQQKLGLPNDLLPDISLALLSGITSAMTLQREPMMIGRNPLAILSTPNFLAARPNYKYFSRSHEDYINVPGVQMEFDVGAVANEDGVYPKFSRVFAAINGNRHQLSSSSAPLALMAYSYGAEVLFENSRDGEPTVVKGGQIKSEIHALDFKLTDSVVRAKIVRIEYESKGFSVYFEKTSPAGIVRERVVIDAGKQEQFIFLFLAMVLRLPVNLNLHINPKGTNDHYFSLNELVLGDWEHVSLIPIPRSSQTLQGTNLEKIKFIGGSVSQWQAELEIAGKRIFVRLNSIWDFMVLMVLASKA